MFEKILGYRELINSFMFTKNTWIILFCIMAISFICVFVATSLLYNSLGSDNPYYTVANTQNSNLTAIVQKEPWQQSTSIKLLNKKKIDKQFVASANNLDSLAISFDNDNKSITGNVIFRLKKTGDKEWYYQNVYNANQFQNNTPFPFDFPKISSSKGIQYIVELEYLSTKHNGSLTLSKVKPYAIAEYKFSKKELLNPKVLSNFLITKIGEQVKALTLETIVTILLLTIFPAVVLIILLLSIRKEKSTVDIKNLLKELTKKVKKELYEKQYVSIKERNDVLLGFLFTFSLTALTVLLIGVVSSPLTRQTKWMPYLSILMPSILFGLNCIKKQWIHKSFLFILSGFFSLFILAQVILYYGIFSHHEIASVFIIICILIAIVLMKYFAVIFAGTLFFLFGINSVAFISNYKWEGLVWIIPVIYIILLSFVVFITMLSFQLTLSEQVYSSFWRKINKIGFLLLMVVSSLLALRTDTLFQDLSEFGWNYFTGVIQTVRSGGELLWSAPSQYGFLNILLPSLLPWTARNSFFIFQAILFILCTFIMLKTIYSSFKNNATFIILSTVALSLFYFADPTLIGPTPYPSSSVIRFFCVYILLYAIWKSHYKKTVVKNRITWMINGSYLLGALWSAESLFYSTTIYFTFLCASTIGQIKLGTKKGDIVKFVSFNVGAVLAGLIFFNMLYFAVTRHLPDWSMFFMYALGYANGFGELSIKPWGIHWGIISVLSGVSFILWRLFAIKKYNEWTILACSFMALWILSSYYVGRASTNNLTALLPIIFYIFMIAVAALKNPKYLLHRMLLTAVFVPWIIVGIIGGIGNPKFLAKAPFFTFAQNIDTKSFQPDENLSAILKSLQVTDGIRIAYYGSPYNNPVISEQGSFFDPIAGMPMPMTLLETPISQERQRIVIQRYFATIHSPVYLIHKKNENMQRFLEWKKFLQSEFIFRQMKIKSTEYEVFQII